MCFDHIFMNQISKKIENVDVENTKKLARAIILYISVCVCVCMWRQK